MGQHKSMSTPANEFHRILRSVLDQWRLDVSASQMGLLRAHSEAVLEANRFTNLTRITNPVEMAIKHYADSLALLLWSRECRIAVRTLLDIGTGAGYPAVPLAIMRPKWSITAIDATAKKVKFLNRVAAELPLANLWAKHAHARHWAERHTFDLVTLRAVGRLAHCLEQATPYVSRGGRVIAYKTASLAPEERRAAEARSARLHLQAEAPFPYELRLKGQILRRVLHIYHRTQ